MYLASSNFIFRFIQLAGYIVLPVYLMANPPGELVWTEPAFPTQFDDITVYFDASEGNAALADFSGDVYAHTGLITSSSTAPNDWKFVQGTWGTLDEKVLMTDEGDNIYSISYNVEEFYGLPNGEVAEKLAFVFRNGDGSIVGRDTDGSDIFHDLYPPEDGLLVNVVAPANDPSIIYQGEILAVNILINVEANVRILDNNIEIYNTSSVSEVNFDIENAALGNHQLEIIVQNEEDEVIINTAYLVLDNNEETADASETMINGINYLSNGNYLFKLTAPNKNHCFFLCSDNEYKVDLNYQMTKSTNGDYFWIELEADKFSDKQHTYQYYIDGSIKIADPFAQVILDPWNDDDINEEVLNELADYPTEFTTGLVTAFDKEKPNYNWQSNDYIKPSNESLIIYEILLRDFLEDHSYNSLIDTLDYLDKLGVNAIELMPIQEFEGNQSWGYNPSFHQAVDKYYGSRDQLKQFIDACHQRGIMVILDVVFNHAFSQSPLCQMYWNPTAFRPSADSPYLNEVAKHPYNVGYDFNHESVYTKEWVKQVLAYWIEDFRFDGFRFDLSKGLTQKDSGNNGELMSQYDSGRVAILKDYADHIWSLDEEAYVILEHFAVNPEERELAEYGMMLWGNISWDFAEAAMGYDSDLNWADYSERNWDEPHLISYAESHDEERMGYKLKTWGNAEGSYSTKSVEVGTNRMAAAAAVYMSIPGPKMYWQFYELGYDYSINTCVDGTVNNNCRLDPKPIRWDYFDHEDRRNLYDKIAAINHLKRTQACFNTTDYFFDDSDSYIKKVYLNDPSLDLVCLANFNVTAADLNPNFPYEGSWYEYFSGNELVVQNTQESLNFHAGEYRIYTSEPLSPPDGYFTETKQVNALNIHVSPNPVLSGKQIYIHAETNADYSIYLQSLMGDYISISAEPSDHGYILECPDVPAGIYILSLKNNDRTFAQKINIAH